MNQSPKKILFCIPALVVGGAERVLVNLCKTINRSFWRPEILLFERGGMLEEELPADVVIHFLPKSKKSDVLGILMKMSSRLLWEIRPDLIVGFMEYANLLALLSTAIAGLHIPVLATEHNCTSILLQNHKHRRVFEFLMKRFYKKASAIVAVSSSVARDLIEKFQVPPELIQVIHNGIDLTDIQNKKKELPNAPFSDFFTRGRIVISAAGRMTPQKNFSLLIHAFSLIRKEMEVKLLIFGDGTEKQALQDLVERLDLARDVFMPGFEPNFYRYVHRSCAFVMSSDFEGFGNVLLEAMACETPVITTNCEGAPRDVIHDGINGRLTPRRNAEKLAATILEVIKNPEYSAMLVKNACSTIASYDISQWKLEYERVFSEILNSRSKSG